MMKFNVWIDAIVERQDTFFMVKRLTMYHYNLIIFNCMLPQTCLFSVPLHVPLERIKIKQTSTAVSFRKGDTFCGIDGVCSGIYVCMHVGEARIALSTYHKWVAGDYVAPGFH
jgi:hypothetical protein